MKERKAAYVTAARGAGIPIPEPEFMQQKGPKSKKEKKKIEITTHNDEGKEGRIVFSSILSII